MVGDIVQRTMAPLSVELGPGMMDNIFDGIQRPLEAIRASAKGSPFVPLGVNVGALDHSRKFKYTAVTSWQEGDPITGGSIIGSVSPVTTIFDLNLLSPCESSLTLHPGGEALVLQL